VEYMRLHYFWKKNVNKFKSSIHGLQSESKSVFLNQFLSLTEKKASPLEILYFYKSSLKNLGKTMPEMKGKEALIFLILCSLIQIAPDDFLLKLYGNIKTEEILSLENIHLNKLLWSYCTMNFTNDKLQKDINSRLSLEMKKDGNGIFESNNLFKYMNSLSFYCALKYDETSFCHNILLGSLEKFFKNNQISDKKACRSIWNFLTAISIKNPENLEKVNFLKKKVPIHTKGVFISELQLSVKKILSGYCEINKLKFEEEKKILCYYADFFVEPNVIIEVNGPFHYINNKTLRKFGFEEVKYQNFRTDNYSIIEINYLNWKRLLGYEQEIFVINYIYFFLFNQCVLRFEINSKTAKERLEKI